MYHFGNDKASPGARAGGWQHRNLMKSACTDRFVYLKSGLSTFVANVCRCENVLVHCYAAKSMYLFMAVAAAICNASNGDDTSSDISSMSFQSEIHICICRIRNLMKSARVSSLRRLTLGERKWGSSRRHGRGTRGARADATAIALRLANDFGPGRYGTWHGSIKARGVWWTRRTHDKSENEDVLNSYMVRS